MRKKIILSTLVGVMASVSLAFAQCPSMDTTNTQTGTGTCTGNRTYSDGRIFNIVALTVNGNLTINGSFTIDDNVVVNGTLNVNGNLNVNGFMTVNGTVYVSGDTNNNIAGQVNVNDTGDFRTDGDFNNGGWLGLDDVNSGDMSIGGTYTNLNGGNMIVEDGGVLEAEDGIVLEDGSTMTVNDGGTISGGSGGITNNGGDPDATLDIDESGGADGDCSDGCCGSGCRSLPVELTYLAIEEHLGQVYLAWETAAELNNEGFEVEWKAMGAEVFEAVGFVSGNGTTSQVHSYQFGVNKYGEGYFRLKQIDYDGEFEYSPIISSRSRNVSSSFEVYPNPTPGRIHLSGTGLIDFTLYDQNGNMLLISVSSEVRETEKLVSDYLCSQSAGIYLLALRTERGVEKLRIVKRNDIF